MREIRNKNQQKIGYEKLTLENFNAHSLDSFIRHQVVTDCYRHVDGEWKWILDEFTEEWSVEECRKIATNISENLDGNMVDIGAFHEGVLVGYITVGTEFFGSRRQYVELVEFEVSEPYRNQGIGTQLFQCACEAAREMGAEKLYISAHSSRESQAAYRKLGCVLALELNPVNVEREPCDVQMEYVLI